MGLIHAVSTATRFWGDGTVGSIGPEAHEALAQAACRSGYGDEHPPSWAHVVRAIDAGHWRDVLALAIEESEKHAPQSDE
jgi:hypothetical protein